MEKIPFIDGDVSLGLTKDEKLCIIAYMVLPIEAWRIYDMFIYPKVKKTGVFLKNESKLFFSSHAAEKYMQEVNRTMSGVPLVKQENNVISQEELEQKIEQSSLVLQSLVCDRLRDANDPEFLDLAKLFMKEVYDKTKDELISPPMRILAENCSNCRYKTAIEKDFIDECVRCKYQINSLIKYSYKDQLIDEEKQTNKE